VELLSADTLYTVGLILVALYLLMGVDDFIWDILTLARRTQRHNQHLELHKLDSIPPKLLAMAIAAWREDNVLGDVIGNIVQSTHYPKSMYHIFLGVYPNDEATAAVALELSTRHQNVHVIINCLPGPTSKAQNLNYVITQIRLFEQQRDWRFASLTIHDSEDVVHPYELKVTNYLLDTNSAMQFPVFPLIQMPRFRNFFANITTCSYADEFAENHFTTMVNRRNAGAFVPSAGTGFALSREALDAFGDGDVLPRDSLTEDYRLSLTLFEKGIKMYYVLERVPRIMGNGKFVWEFIATRSIFPNTFKTAVKQKTRWILGITMQSFKIRDIFKASGLSFIGRYSLYKDLKAKVGNMVVFVGYPVLVYFFASLLLELTPIYPLFTLSWWLSLIVTVMMIERQIFRGVAMYKVYGARSVFFACLFPPVIPMRVVWGNIINMVATIKAYKQKIFGQQAGQKKAPPKAAHTSPKAKKFAWDKTDHAFLGKEVLWRFHRKLGDALIAKGYISAWQLQEALRNMPDTPQSVYEYALRQIGAICKKQGGVLHSQLDEIFEQGLKKQTLGSYFLDAGIITEGQLLSALSHVKHVQYVEEVCIGEYDIRQFAPYFDKALLHRLLAVPLMKTEQGFVFAFCDSSPHNAQTVLREKYGLKVSSALASQSSIEAALAAIYSLHGSLRGISHSLISHLYSDGVICYEQAIIARNYKAAGRLTEARVLKYMGLLPEAK